MSVQSDIRHCSSCKKETLQHSTKISHLLHIVLSFLSSGFWLLIYIPILLFSGSKRICNECGSISKTHSSFVLIILLSILFVAFEFLGRFLLNIKNVINNLVNDPQKYSKSFNSFVENWLAQNGISNEQLANYVILFFGAFFVIIFFSWVKEYKEQPKNIFKLKSKDSVINSDSLISECLNDQGFQRIVHSLKNKGIVLEKHSAGVWKLKSSADPEGVLVSYYGELIEVNNKSF